MASNVPSAVHVGVEETRPAESNLWSLSEKRNYRFWQHEDWNEEFRRLIPKPEPESYTEVRDWNGRIIRRCPEISGALETYYTSPWEL